VSQAWEGSSSARDPAELRHALGVPVMPKSLDRALTHRSYAYENANPPTNERLEFLGDAVLGLVVTDALFRGYPDLPEGQLAKLRAAVVNQRALAGVARGLRLGDFVRLGRGEQGTGGRDKASILADTLEALIGAVYIECGLDEASALVHRLFDPVIASSARLGAGRHQAAQLGLLPRAALQDQQHAPDGLAIGRGAAVEFRPGHGMRIAAQGDELVHVHRLPMDVLRPPQRKSDQPRADGSRQRLH
jgi:dsRNA-specific ribonuclease